MTTRRGLLAYLAFAAVLGWGTHVHLYAQDCPTGFADCDGNSENGCETSITDVDNCGGCGTAAPGNPNDAFICSTNHLTGSACVAGRRCAGTCDAGWDDCDTNKSVAGNGCEANLNVAGARTGGPTPNYTIPGYPEGIVNCGVCSQSCDDGNGCTTDLCVPGATVGSCQRFNRNRCATARCGGGYFSGSDEAGLTNQSACADPDSDGDKIPDAWEVASSNPYTGATNPVGIDINCDGVIDGTDFQYPIGELPSLSTKDVYLKIVAMGQRPGDGSVPCATDDDCLAAGGSAYCDGTSCTDEPPGGHAPLQSSIALANAGLLTRGIRLHVDYNAASPTLVTHDDNLKFFTTDSCDLVPFADYFTQVKAPNWNSKLQYVYHFAVFAHDWCRLEDGAHPSGNAEIGGNDISITLGDSLFGIPTFEREGKEGGTLLHQLGHNLALQHLLPKRAPNHLSIMNYRYQFNGIFRAVTPTPPTGPAQDTATRRLDYSDFDMADIDENNTNESLVLQPGSPDTITYNCPSGLGAVGLAGAGVDWNCGAGTTPQVNTDGVTPITYDHHGGRNDLPLMNPEMLCLVTFQNGAPLPANHRTDQPGNGEYTVEEAIANGEFYSILQVSIDVRFGCTSNWIFLGSNGSVPITLLGSATLNVRDVVVSSLEFIGAKPKSKYYSDVNDDGFTDLTLLVKQPAIKVDTSSTYGTLRGTLANGQELIGSDLIHVSSGTGPGGRSCPTP